MKKKIFGILLAVISFFIAFSGKVNAIKCSYGTRDGDDASTWKKVVVFEVDDYNKIYIDRDNSPYLAGAANPTAVSIDNDVVVGFEYEDSATFTDTYTVVASLYSSSDMYNDIKSSCIDYRQEQNNDNKDYSSECGCPPTIKFNQGEKGIASIEHFLVVYNDELVLEADSVKAFMEKYNPTPGMFIEERYKGDKLEDIMIGGCPTYSYAMNSIKNTMSKNGCNGNPDFDKKFADIEEKCENFKTSYAYANDDATPRACSKECANLYDEVDEYAKNICNKQSKNSYCGSLGNKMVNWIFRIIRLVRYGLPAVVIILAILDYIKALSSEDDGEMKKVNKRFMFRLIAVALLFVIPFIIDFILGLFNIPGLSADNPFCAK